ncbi:MAG: SlyX family protein [Thiotrichaceae bacterium]
METLSQQLYLQQQEIRHLLLQMEQLKERMKAMASSIVATAAEETPPPHY